MEENAFRITCLLPQIRLRSRSLSIHMIFVYCRPLLKLVDRLLLVGMLRNEDIMKLLIMIHPETWDPTFDKGKLCCNNPPAYFVSLIQIKIEIFF